MSLILLSSEMDALGNAILDRSVRRRFGAESVARFFYGAFIPKESTVKLKFFRVLKGDSQERLSGRLVVATVVPFTDCLFSGAVEISGSKLGTVVGLRALLGGMLSTTCPRRDSFLSFCSALRFAWCCLCSQALTRGGEMASCLAPAEEIRGDGVTHRAASTSFPRTSSRPRQVSLPVPGIFRPFGVSPVIRVVPT